MVALPACSSAVPIDLRPEPTRSSKGTKGRKGRTVEYCRPAFRSSACCDVLVVRDISRGEGA